MLPFLIERLPGQGRRSPVRASNSVSLSYCSGPSRPLFVLSTGRTSRCTSKEETGAKSNPLSLEDKGIVPRLAICGERVRNLRFSQEVHQLPGVAVSVFVIFVSFPRTSILQIPRAEVISDRIFLDLATRATIRPIVSALRMGCVWLIKVQPPSICRAVHWPVLLVVFWVRWQLTYGNSTEGQPCQRARRADRGLWS